MIVCTVKYKQESKGLKQWFLLAVIYHYSFYKLNNNRILALQPKDGEIRVCTSRGVLCPRITLRKYCSICPFKQSFQLITEHIAVASQKSFTYAAVLGLSPIKGFQCTSAGLLN